VLGEVAGQERIRLGNGGLTARPYVSFGAADDEQEGKVGALSVGDRVAAAPADVAHGASLRN
jgi:hypothetical protein